MLAGVVWAGRACGCRRRGVCAWGRPAGYDRRFAQGDNVTERQLSRGDALPLVGTDGRPLGVCVGVWFDGEPDDVVIDLFAALLDASGKLPSNEHLVFHKQLESPCGSLAQDGSDWAFGWNALHEQHDISEPMRVMLRMVPDEIERILCVLQTSRYADEPQPTDRVMKVTFGIIDLDSLNELARVPAPDEFERGSIAIGEFVRSGHAWEFRALLDLFPEGIESALRSKGCDV